MHMTRFAKVTWFKRTGERLVRLGWGRRALVITIPYLWLLLFFAVPFLIVLGVSFSKARIGLPPYEPLVQRTSNGLIQLKMNFDNFLFLFKDSLYFSAYLNSLRIAAISTLLCLLIGYPMAYAIARAPSTSRNFLLLLVILPFWTSLLLRVYAWIGILKNNGLLNNLLMWMRIIDRPIVMLQTEFAIYVGIVYSYLPFMVLPLYANLQKMDLTLLEAAADLGCRPTKAFFAVTLPLSMPGVLAGSMLVFIPAVGEFVIPELLGGPNALMIGKVLWTEFFNNRDWPVASAVATVLLIVLVAPVVYLQRARAGDKAEVRA